MKHSIVVAALCAVAIAGCGKTEPTSAPIPAPVKEQAGDASKAEPAKTAASTTSGAPTGPQTSAAAVVPSTANAPGGANPVGPEAKPGEGATSPTGAQPVKKDTK